MPCVHPATLFLLLRKTACGFCTRFSALLRRQASPPASSHGWRLSLPGRMQPRFRGSGSVGPGVQTVGAGRWVGRWVGLVRCGALHSAHHTFLLLRKTACGFCTRFSARLRRACLSGGAVWVAVYLCFGGCFFRDGYKTKPAGSAGLIRRVGKGAVTYSPTFAVPSAWRGLTSLFGMGRGGAPALLPP